MSKGMAVEVYGNYALFTRPEFKAERVTYDVITPSAARGILESIYWHPGIHYVIDKIVVENPIKHMNIMRNEVKSKISLNDIKQEMIRNEMIKENGGTSLCTSRISTPYNISQRNSIILKDVKYVIFSHFDLDEEEKGEETTPSKVQAMLALRIAKGAAYSQPYFGCREFPAYFRPWEGDPNTVSGIPVTKDLGLMLYDINYSNMSPVYFDAHLKNGVIDVKGEQKYGCIACAG